jgi:hypothetical protein
MTAHDEDDDGKRVSARKGSINGGGGARSGASGAGANIPLIVGIVFGVILVGGGAATVVMKRKASAR